MNWGPQVSCGFMSSVSGAPYIQEPRCPDCEWWPIPAPLMFQRPELRHHPASLPLQPHCTCLTALSSTYTLVVDTPNSCQSQLLAIYDANLIVILWLKIPSKALLPLECSDLPRGEGACGAGWAASVLTREVGSDCCDFAPALSASPQNWTCQTIPDRKDGKSWGEGEYVNFSRETRICPLSLFPHGSCIWSHHISCLLLLTWRAGPGSTHLCTPMLP